MDYLIRHGKSSQKIVYNFVSCYLGLLKDVFCKELIYQQFLTYNLYLYIENNVGYVPKHPFSIAFDFDNQYGYCSGNVNGSLISYDDDLIKISNKECYSNAYVK